MWPIINGQNSITIILENNLTCLPYWCEVKTKLNILVSGRIIQILYIKKYQYHYIKIHPVKVLQFKSRLSKSTHVLLAHCTYAVMCPL